ncbi:MAG: glycine C-acetyltransferase [Akkermansia sp.]
MYNTDFKNRLVTDLAGLKAAGLFKQERYIATPQFSEVGLKDGSKVINMCANNYLGLANSPVLEQAAKEAIDKWGFGMASVRFICGTQTLHQELEERLSAFLGTEDTILFGSCFDANGGLFGALLDKEDAIISDALNHASIIDGVRLCKAARYRYANNDMADLEAKLQEAKAAGARTILISTDGVFSMDGIIASLDKIHALAEKYGALVHFDESHATGVLGERGRGTHEHCGLFGKIDITTGTFGKALGGASGGYVAARKEIVDILRQKARPYLFSNSVMPAIAATTIKVLDLLESSNELTQKVQHNAAYFRKGMEQCGFNLAGAGHAIVPVMIGDAALSQKMSDRLLELGVYAMGFFYPVVPKGQARIRTQISAAHTEEQLDRAIAAFAQAGKELGIIA